MLAFVVRRILQTIPLLLGVSFLTFAVINQTGSPLTAAEFNPRARPEDIERIRENLGLDRPWLERYFIWLGNLLQGDLGLSLNDYRPVTTSILDVLPYTMLLSALAILVSLLIAVPIGIYSAVHRNSFFDRVGTIMSVLAFAVPTVWLGLMLIFLFAVRFSEWGLPALPVGRSYNARGGGDFIDRAVHLILPVTALALPQIAGWTRYIRSSMLEVIRQDYVRTADAKGLHQRAVLYGHAFRNALLPLVTLVGLSLPELFAGGLVVENVFALNGMGRLSVEAVFNRDYTMVMGTTLFFSLLVVLGNLLSDVLYAVMDPRLRFN